MNLTVNILHKSRRLIVWISPDLALRLEKAGISTARFWNNLQANYNLWIAMQHEIPLVRRLQENVKQTDYKPS